jgi:dipeptidyl aminopeptidase/acylaminoacyl peptidase
MVTFPGQPTVLPKGRLDMIPLEDFFRKPEKADLQLSPSGKYLAFKSPFQRRMNIFVQDIDTGKAFRVTASTGRDIGGYLWANDDRLIFAQDTGGDENHRLYSIRRDGTDRIELTPFEGVQCSIVDDLEDVEDEILIQMNRRDPNVFDVFRMDVTSGKMTLIAENPGNILRWMTDHDGKLRLASTTDGVNTSILYREKEEDAWSTVATYNFRESAVPLFFTFDNRSIYVSSNIGRDKAAIFEYDLESGKEGTLVFEHPDVDVTDLLHSRKQKKITGVAFETDRLGYHFFDDRRKKIQGFLDEKLPGYENRLVSHSRDESIFVVHSGSDRTFGGYYLLETAEMTLSHLFDATPWLREENLAEMRPITYPSRDGWIIHGYLTLPVSMDPTNLPLLIHPHGGPWFRDSWGYNPEVQFLANRGMAVLQMNFRGSTGYGKKFWEAGFRQWGLAMQDDITDAVQWATDEGIADPKRIAISGGSYGGYAALSALTGTPDIYACGISYVGISNLFTWIAAIPPYWTPYLDMMYEMVGHPERDEERFRETSPYFNADKIQVPLLVAQGANDPRVRKEESDQIVDALRKRGIAVEYIVKENEGHGFLNEENQFDFYRAMESFLSSHIPGLTE